MSAPLYRIPLKLRALLHERDCSVAKLATEARLPLRRVQDVLGHHPRAKARDRLVVARCLTPEERGVLFRVEQSAPCSTEPLTQATA